MAKSKGMGGTDMRRPGKGELGDLDHLTEVEAGWTKGKDHEGDHARKRAAKMADRKKRGKGRH